MNIMNTIVTGLPNVYIKRGNGIIDLSYEEESIVWLWANPGLLQWSNEIVWLDSP